MRPLFGAALAAALLFGAVGASAETLARLFPPVASEVTTRLGPLTGKLTRLQKKQRAALTKASKFLAVETDDVGKTIADAVAASAAIESAFAADSTFTGLLDPIVGTMIGIVSGRRDGLTASIDALPAGKKKNAVQKAATTADKYDAKFTAATTFTARLKALQKKYASIVAGEKQAAKAGLGVIATVSLDVDIEGSKLHLPGLPPFNLTAEYFSAPPGTFRLHAMGGAGATRHTFTFEVASPGPGQRDVKIGPMSNYATFPLSGPPLMAVAGSVVDFTTWDPEHGKVAAKFTVTYSNGTSTVHLTGGSLTSIALQTF